MSRQQQTGQTETHSAVWTGTLLLELRNARDWPGGLLDLTVGFDVVHARHQGRTIGVLDREAFTAWLRHPDTTHQVDDTAWAVVGEVVTVTIGGSFFTIRPTSVGLLRAALR